MADDNQSSRRSAATYGKQDKDGFIHRSWLKNQGFPDRVFVGRPIIGICQTFSEFNPCHSHFRDIAEAPSCRSSST